MNGRALVSAGALYVPTVTALCSSVLITKTTHPAYSRLDAYVSCKGCTFTFDRKLGELTVKTGKSTTSVTATVVAAPVGIKAKTLYADHAWSRTWQATAK